MPKPYGKPTQEPSGQLGGLKAQVVKLGNVRGLTGQDGPSSQSDDGRPCSFSYKSHLDAPQTGRENYRLK